MDVQQLCNWLCLQVAAKIGIQGWLIELHQPTSIIEVFVWEEPIGYVGQDEGTNPGEWYYSEDGGDGPFTIDSTGDLDHLAATVAAHIISIRD